MANLNTVRPLEPRTRCPEVSTQISKADQKEISMTGIRDFIKDNMPRMMEYLRAVSTPRSSIYSNHRFEDRDDRSVLNNLAQHKATLPVLERESVPALPHYIDPARELAIVASAVVRHSRDINNKTKARKLGDVALERLCAACFEVEGEALQRVNELATRLAQERRRASASAAWIKNSASLSTSQPLASSSTSIQGRESSLSHYASSTMLEVVSHPVGGSHPDKVTPIRGYSRNGNIEVASADAGGSVVSKWESLEPPVLEVLDDGAKRKKSFMRGIFGGESKSGNKSRH